MTREQAVASILAGASLASELADRGATAIALGEMGIGNTTSAAAVACALLDRSPGELCGPGTGLAPEGVARKTEVVAAMLERNAPDPSDPVAVLAALGGFEIGVLAGVALRAAAARCVVVLDGFITGAAALVAVRLSPALGGISSHRTARPSPAIASSSTPSGSSRSSSSTCGSAKEAARPSRCRSSRPPGTSSWRWRRSPAPA